MEEKLMTNPYYAKAIEYIRTHDLNAMENGKHFIDGDNLFVNIMECNMKTVEQARLEVHDKYIDIQIPLSGEETYGLAEFDPAAEGSFDESKDIGFYDQKVVPVTLKPGEFAIFFPNTCAHAPACTLGEPCKIRKIIVKVKA